MGVHKVFEFVMENFSLVISLQVGQDLLPSIPVLVVAFGTPEVDWGYALMTLGGIFIFFIGVLYWQLVKREVSIE